MKEEEKFQLILNKVIELDPSMETAFSIINAMILHISFKGAVTGALNTPEQIKKEQNKIDEFSVNVKDYMRFKLGRP